jgi:hypothetical protein
MHKAILVRLLALSRKLVMMTGWGCGGPLGAGWSVDGCEEMMVREGMRGARNEEGKAADMAMLAAADRVRQSQELT